MKTYYVSNKLKKELIQWYMKYTKTNPLDSFLDWVQLQRSHSRYFDPMIQGCSGLEIDDLLFQYSVNRNINLIFN